MRLWRGTIHAMNRAAAAARPVGGADDALCHEQAAGQPHGREDPETDAQGQDAVAEE